MMTLKEALATICAMFLVTVWVAAKKPSTAADGNTGPEAGVNIISVGNTYNDPQFQDVPLDRLFTALKERGIRRISLRVTWATMERQEGTLNPEILANMKRIYGKARDHGFKAMLDFHTFFAIDSYACPPWVAQHTQGDGSPGLRSIAMLARSEAVRNRFPALLLHRKI